MCGIAGVLGLASDAPPPSVDELRRMASALHHRGPDAAGIYHDAQAGLSHARLSIVDLAGGKQPLANEDGSLWICFNGEIFNHVELRAELTALGHVFRTRSDTEAIVHAFEQWGHGCFARFNGQFALALWDARARTLTLARDRIGILPLYVCATPRRVLFASEAKAIFAGDPAIARDLDPVALAQTFTFWTPIAPRTAFTRVEELEPGEVRTYARGDVQRRRFWEPGFPPRGEEPFAGSIDDAAAATRSALRRATELRLVRADVPVGCYLSGGLDSSLVAALGREAVGPTFPTFSLRFDDREYDETEFQRAVARRLGTEHHELSVSKADIAEAFPRAVEHAERPLLRTAPAPLLLLSGLVHRAGIKVVLTGEGADELFAGYDLFREARVRRFWARRPDSAWRPRLLARLYPYLARSPVALPALARQFFGRNLESADSPSFSHEPRWRGTAALQRLFAADLRRAIRGRDVVAELRASLPDESASWDPLARDQLLEMRTLLSNHLLSAQGDRMLMANSVEGRFPYLDPEVIDLAASLPASFKLLGLCEKRVLKHAARGLLPDQVLARKKQPYRAPDALALVRAEWLGDVLSPRAVREAGIFDPVAVEQLAAKCRAARGQLSHSDNLALVGVASTQLLHEQLVRRAPQPALVPAEIVR
jgi:asparagine synthase (glutamine-hydrolysing)